MERGGTAAGRAATSSSGNSFDTNAVTQKVRRVFLGAVVAAAIIGSAAATFMVVRSGLNAETRSDKWQFVEAATDASKAANAQVAIFVDKSNKLSPATAITLTDADEDQDTTAKMLTAQRNGSTAEASQAFKAAQDIPNVNDAETGQPLPRQEPATSAALPEKLNAQQSRLFRIKLRDCAAEDGDVVDIMLNGATYATVPLTNAGAALTIPLENATPNNLVLRGMRDGGGGITIEFITSQGSYFCGAMTEGEECPLGVITPKAL